MHNEYIIDRALELISNNLDLRVENRMSIHIWWPVYNRVKERMEEIMEHVVV